MLERSFKSTYENDGGSKSKNERPHNGKYPNVINECSRARNKGMHTNESSPQHTSRKLTSQSASDTEPNSKEQDDTTR